MELTCSRCHQTVETADCYCPFCGLPQFVYAAEDSAGPGQPDRWGEAVRDAGSVDWKPALRSALLLAVPAGILCSMLSPVGIFGLLLMAASSVWVVALYMRNRRPAWITIGAGARIGLVTGVVGGWTAAADDRHLALCHALLAAPRQRLRQFLAEPGEPADEPAMDIHGSRCADDRPLPKSWMLSPEGRAGWVLCAITFLMATLLLFAVGGGALGARLLGRPRRSAE